MNAERVGIELIVSVIAWFALVLVAFFFVGPVVGIITIIEGGIAAMPDRPYRVMTRGAIQRYRPHCPAIPAGWAPRAASSWTRK